MILIYSYHVPRRNISHQCTATINTIYIQILLLSLLLVLPSIKCYMEMQILYYQQSPVCLFPECKYVIFNTTSAKSTMVSVETFFSFRVSSRFLNEDKPPHSDKSSSFGYNPTISIVHKIMSSGKCRRERNFFRNSLVSLI